MHEGLKDWLDTLAERYNTPEFITDDPVSVPHRFSRLQDIEIAAFWTAMLSWGQRKTIIRKAEELLAMMDNAPYAFVCGHQDSDRRPFLQFKHRTFQPDDTLYFLEFFRQYYRRHDSLETAFSAHLRPEHAHTGPVLAGFHRDFFSLPDAPGRTRKHIPTPERQSTCKRLNMFLRWMVRRDDRGVDFGLWQSIGPSRLLMPLDVHVERVARHLGLLQRRQRDWQAVLELTAALRQFDPGDPVKYDFALFGWGVVEKKAAFPFSR